MSKLRFGVVTDLVVCSVSAGVGLSASKQADHPRAGLLVLSWRPTKPQQALRRHWWYLTLLLLSCHTRHTRLGPCCHYAYPATQNSLLGQSPTLDPISFLHPECNCWMNLPIHTFWVLKLKNAHSNSQLFEAPQILLEKVQNKPALQSALLPAIFHPHHHHPIGTLYSNKAGMLPRLQVPSEVLTQFLLLWLPLDFHFCLLLRSDPIHVPSPLFPGSFSRTTWPILVSFPLPRHLIVLLICLKHVALIKVAWTVSSSCPQLKAVQSGGGKHILPMMKNGWLRPKSATNYPFDLSSH